MFHANLSPPLKEQASAAKSPLDGNKPFFRDTLSSFNRRFEALAPQVTPLPIPHHHRTYLIAERAGGGRVVWSLFFEKGEKGGHPEELTPLSRRPYISVPCVRRKPDIKDHKDQREAQV